MEEIQQIKEEIADDFDITDLGEIQYLLGWEVTRDSERRTLTIGQEKYCKEVLQTDRMSNSAPVQTPMEPSIRFSKDDSPGTPEEKSAMAGVPYRELVRSLMYLMVSSRPDIAFPIGVLSKFVSNPGR